MANKIETKDSREKFKVIGSFELLTFNSGPLTFQSDREDYQLIDLQCLSQYPRDIWVMHLFVSFLLLEKQVGYWPNPFVMAKEIILYSLCVCMYMCLCVCMCILVCVCVCTMHWSV